MKETGKLAAILIIVLVATTLLGASFQLIDVRVQMPGFGSLLSPDNVGERSPGSAGAGTNSGGEPGSSGSAGHDALPDGASTPEPDVPVTAGQPVAGPEKIETLLDLELPAEALAGDEFQVSTVLVENASGKPLAGIPITIGTGLFSTCVVTDEQGRGRANVSFSSAGNHTVMATFGGNAGFTGSSAAREVTVTEKPLYDWLSGLVLPIVLAVIATIALTILIVAACLILGKVRKPRGDRVPVVQARTADRPVQGPETGYRIEFEGIESPLPAVWGVGEPLHIRLIGPENCHTTLGLFVDGEQIDEVRIEAGAGFSSVLPGKGEHLLTVKADSEVLAASTVRIVDYREEIVRLFNSFYASVRAQSETLPGDATPREMQWAISARLSREHQGSLDRAVSTFEIANYSTHTVGRKEYVTSYISVQELKI
ncbi:Ig-like domain-containing protein [Methanocella sp. MCL-LM]|uniref:Ig-like domain-containing protein n=1 Tax=Methanocella sp. MCL-LM TaxID=3412035 RepID=UPI003C71BBFF